jgi:hypothetical protein
VVVDGYFFVAVGVFLGHQSREIIRHRNDLGIKRTGRQQKNYQPTPRSFGHGKTYCRFSGSANTAMWKYLGSGQSWFVSRDVFSHTKPALF